MVDGTSPIGAAHAIEEGEEGGEGGEAADEGLLRENLDESSRANGLYHRLEQPQTRKGWPASAPQMPGAWNSLYNTVRPNLNLSRRSTLSSGGPHLQLAHRSSNELEGN